MNIRTRCSGCGAEKRPTKFGYCPACDQANRRARLAQPGRRCPNCRKPLTSRMTRCGRCNWQVLLRASRRPGRCCPACGQRKPRGYRSVRCPECRALEYWRRTYPEAARRARDWGTEHGR